MSMNDITTTLSHLKSKVSEFAVKDNFSNFPKNNNILEKLKSPFVLYGIFPIITLFILILIKPKFITQKIEIEGELPRYKISLTKLIVTVIIILVISYLLLFSYLYKKQ